MKRFWFIIFMLLTSALIAGQAPTKSPSMSDSSLQTLTIPQNTRESSSEENLQTVVQTCILETPNAQMKSWQEFADGVLLEGQISSAKELILMQIRLMNLQKFKSVRLLHSSPSSDDPSLVFFQMELKPLSQRM